MSDVGLQSTESARFRQLAELIDAVLLRATESGSAADQAERRRLAALIEQAESEAPNSIQATYLADVLSGVVPAEPRAWTYVVAALVQGALSTQAIQSLEELAVRLDQSHARAATRVRVRG
jgi:hypothetical protein